MSGSGSKNHSKNNKNLDLDSLSVDKNKNVSHVPCKFFLKSACQLGDKCPFSHKVDSEAIPVCKYFKKGTCKFGNKCALAHITPDGRHVNKKKEKKKEKKEKKQKADVSVESNDSSLNRSSSSGSSSGHDHVTNVDHIPVDHPHQSKTLKPRSSSSIETANLLLSRFSNSMPKLEKSTASASFSTPSVSAQSLPSLAPAWSGMRLNRFQEGSAIIDDDDEDRMDDDEDDDVGYAEQLLPSSLEDLLTPTERERRNSRNSMSRPIKRSSMPLNGSESLRTFQNRHNSHSYYTENNVFGSPTSSDIWRSHQRPSLMSYQSNNAIASSWGERTNSFGAATRFFEMYDASLYVPDTENLGSPIGSPIGHSATLYAMRNDHNPLTNY